MIESVTNPNHNLGEGRGQIEPRDAKLSEKCLCSHYDKPALKNKQISHTAIVMMYTLFSFFFTGKYKQRHGSKYLHLIELMSILPPYN